MSVTTTSLLSYITTTLSSSVPLFDTKVETLHLPVNLNIFDAYYKTFSQHQYKDEYNYKGKVFVFQESDKNKSFFEEDYLKELGFLGKRNFQNGTKKPEKLQDHEYVNWSNNGAGLKLHHLLNINLQQQKVFSPFIKDFYLKHDFQHTARIPYFAYYFTKNTGIKNLYDDIKFGKRKNNPSFSQDIDVRDGKYDAYYAPKGTDKCDYLRNNKFNGSLKITEVEEDGYEGICTGINLSKHYAFPTLNTVKWTTPYVSMHKKAIDGYYYWLHYRYFNLGDFFETQTRSSNVLSEESTKDKRAWIVNYDDMFKLDINADALTISLDINKIPENYQDFLKISSAFDFGLHYSSQNGQTRSHTFTMKQVLEGTASIRGGFINDIFKNFVIKVSSNDDNVMLLGGKDGSFLFKPNIKSLENKGYLLDKFEFSDDNKTKFFPSELLDNSKFINFFFSSSKNSRKVNVDRDAINNIFKASLVKYDDKTGTATISYFLNNREEIVEISGFKKIPHIKSQSFKGTNANEVFEELKKQYSNVSDYFWSHIELIQEEKPGFLSDEVKYKVKVKPNKNLNWQFTPVEIRGINSSSMAPILKIKDKFDYVNLSNNFYLSDAMIKNGFQMEDFDFSLIKNDTDFSRVWIKVSLKNTKHKPGYNIEDFRIYDVSNVSFNSKNNEFELAGNSSSMLSTLETTVLAVGGTALTGGLVGLGLRKFVSLKK